MDKFKSRKRKWRFQPPSDWDLRGKSNRTCQRRIEATSLSRYEKLRKYDGIKLPESSENSLLSNNRLHNSSSARRLRKMLQRITTNPTPGISAHLKEENLYEWEAAIEGPSDSPYEGGTFLLDITFPAGYPFKPPKVTFLTKIYHCNINSKGCVGLDVLRENWSPASSARTILVSIQALLTDCYPDNALVPEIAEQYVNNREEHDRICKEWTKKYASDESEMYPCLL